MTVVNDNRLHADPGIEAHPMRHTTTHAAEGTTTIFQRGAPGRRAFVCPELDVPRHDY